MGISARDRGVARHSIGDDDNGFTLIELMIALLIVAILFAIAIPTFLALTEKSYNTSAQSNLQTALTAVKAYYDENQSSFIGVLGGNGPQASSLTGIDPGMQYVTGTSASPDIHTVSVNLSKATAPPNAAIGLATYSPGTRICWMIIDVTQTLSAGGYHNTFGISTPGTYYIAADIHHATPSNCSASSPTGSGSNQVSASGFPTLG